MDSETEAVPMPILPLIPDRWPEAAQVLARAFHVDPIQKAVYPDPETRATSTPHTYDSLIRTTEAYGGIMTTTPDLAGVALWAPPGREMTLGSMMRGFSASSLRAFRGISLSSARGLIGMFTLMPRKRREHVPEPHWYLATLGVDPARQGEGVGRALVNDGLARADSSEARTYLETETEYNVGFYESLGFRVVEKMAIPHLGLPLWLMIRDPV